MKMTKALIALLLALSLFAGCGAAKGETASVQAISMICSYGNIGMQNRFAGMVSARSEVKIEKDEARTVEEIRCKEGDEVKAGDVLFTYDDEQAALLEEKAALEIEQMKAEIKAKQTERSQFEKDKQKVSKDDRLSYTLEIQACDAAIREMQYNLKIKEKEIARLKESLGSAEVTSPVDGQVISMNPNGDLYDSNGQKKPFISLMESGAYRIRGTFNENNASVLTEGTEVQILSRVDDSVWMGVISQIDWEHPVTKNNGYEEAVIEGASVGVSSASSSYPFYVEMEDSEGLRLGQHVYIELAFAGEEKNPDSIYLPSCYLVDFTEEGAYVWAEGRRGKLEKRAVKLGLYEEETDTYEILEGLSMEDFIAFPSDTLAEGMKCTRFDESAFEAEGSVDGAEGITPKEDAGYIGDAIAEEGLPIEEYPEEEPLEEGVVFGEDDSIEG